MDSHRFQHGNMLTTICSPTLSLHPHLFFPSSSHLHKYTLLRNSVVSVASSGVASETQDSVPDVQAGLQFFVT